MLVAPDTVFVPLDLCLLSLLCCVPWEANLYRFLCVWVGQQGAPAGGWKVGGERALVLSGVATLCDFSFA